MEGTVAVTLSTILTDIGTIVTQALTWASSVVTFIQANPIVMVFVLIPLVGLGIGMVKRMISL